MNDAGMLSDTDILYAANPDLLPADSSAVESARQRYAAPASYRRTADAAFEKARAHYGLAVECMHPRWTGASTGECPDCAGEGIRWVSAAEVAEVLRLLYDFEAAMMTDWGKGGRHNLWPTLDKWGLARNRAAPILAAHEAASARDGSR